MEPRIVVVGASLGGLRAAEQLRSAGWSGQIVVIGDEPHPPYNRPPLSKATLAAPGTVRESLAALTFRPKRSATDVTWKLGTAVTAADLAAGVLELDDGERITFTGLVVASGLRPARVPAPGPLAGRHVVRRLEDSLALHAELAPGARVVVVGSGFIGCEVAATAATLGARVTLIEGGLGPMERTLGPALSAGVRGLLERHGVHVIPGARVIGFRGAGRCTGVALADGTEVGADVVVEAVGSVPNTAWLAGNGLDLADGVECDARLRVVDAAGTALPNVVAVGDVARYPDGRTAGPARRVEHWATPTDTAKIAAPTLVAALAGEQTPAPEPPLPSFWTDLFNVRIQGVGSPARADRIEVFEGDPAAPATGAAVGYYLGDRLIGAVTAGLPAPRQLYYRQQVLDASAPATLATV
ncbi:NAD(P)/FAD-dependent oxidoreductase [Specibacter cremeus]|uniref:NAD(P)/FAD-dependent oxidoreductase n=1 Tax=Specibacter cremeus TaxID=1629051 RepID=UPI000F7B735C|nr:FAD-dependent oxidoreductase [Specibacter cremeus]